MRMQIIGLAGASGSGKNTVAGMLAAELLDQGFTVKLDGFGMPIKKRILARKAEKSLSAVIDKQADRVAMQDIGAAVRSVDPGYYIKYLDGRNNCDCAGLRRVCTWKPADFLIVSDVRYPAEAAFIKAAGGVLIHVCGCKNPLKGAAAAHESESHFAELFSGADYAIAPQQDLEHLAAAVKALVAAGEHLKKQQA